MERRLFLRAYKSLRFEYQAQLQGSENFFSNWAVVKDISWGRPIFYIRDRTDAATWRYCRLYFQIPARGCRSPTIPT